VDGFGEGVDIVGRRNLNRHRVTPHDSAPGLSRCLDSGAWRLYLG
jgi:hypothetical protein